MPHVLDEREASRGRTAPGLRGGQRGAGQQGTDLAVIDLFEADAEWAKQRRPTLVEIARDRLAVLDRVLTAKSYLLGDQFTYPDILMATALHEIQHTDLLEIYPNITSYLGRCDGRPAWRRCLDAYKKRLGKP